MLVVLSVFLAKLSYDSVMCESTFHIFVFPVGTDKCLFTYFIKEKRRKTKVLANLIRLEIAIPECLCFRTYLSRDGHFFFVLILALTNDFFLFGLECQMAVEILFPVLAMP